MPSSTSTDSSTVALGGFGLNVTHYFMPANVFLTLTPSATVLGVAAQGFLAINRDQGASAPTWWTLGGGILFSATYN